MDSKICIKRKKIKKTDSLDNFETWVYYWRNNPHRFIEEYLGLNLYDFQEVLIYMMNEYPQFIYVSSRGLGKWSD